jgi:hypothetical protein
MAMRIVMYTYNPWTFAMQYKRNIVSIFRKKANVKRLVSI